MEPTVTMTILVIGSVTAKQYQPIRLDFLRKGRKPLIKRCSFEDLAICTSSEYCGSKTIDEGKHIEEGEYIDHKPHVAWWIHERHYGGNLQDHLDSGLSGDLELGDRLAIDATATHLKESFGEIDAAVFELINDHPIFDNFNDTLELLIARVLTGPPLGNDPKEIEITGV